MIYCLMTEDGKNRVEISCSVAARPDSLRDLAEGVAKGDIKLIKPKKHNPNWCSKTEGKKKLDTDWERTGLGSRLINWPRMEDVR